MFFLVNLKTNSVRFLKKMTIFLFTLIILFGCKKKQKINNTAIDPNGDEVIFVTYIPDNTTNFANPERGWYGAYNPPCCDEIPNKILGPHAPILLSDLQALKNNNKITLIRYIVKIQQYVGDIPQTRLNQIQADLNTVRQAGLKVVWRIAYNWGITTGEAPANIISRHIEQLKPIIRNNSDVIFVYQSGLFGGSGESCCLSFLIGESNNNGWQHLMPKAISLYNELLSYVPNDRSFNLRYPSYKYQMMGWSNSATKPITAYPIAAIPLTEAQAYNGSNQARFGFYQENFAGDEFGYGFFNAWGKKDINFVKDDTKYALMEGELSEGTDYNKVNGAAIMQRDHYTAFHLSTFGGDYEGGQQTIPTWTANGQLATMNLKLGYRYKLNSGIFPAKSIAITSNLNITLNITNDGWARIANPRKFEIVLRNQSGGAIFTIDIDGDGKGNRMWLPGEGETKDLVINKALPANISAGTYDLFLNLPDPYPSLRNNPNYSIRLANKNTWEATTGYNNLNKNLIITKGSSVKN